jgi:hypothetical protein
LQDKLQATMRLLKPCDTARSPGASGPVRLPSGSPFGRPRLAGDQPNNPAHGFWNGSGPRFADFLLRYWG